MTSQTRTSIQQAFLQLARENPTEKITVTDIVTAAGINRNSFYYYFEDLPGMIEITMQELFERTIQARRPRTFQECLNAIADIMMENRSVCLHLFRSRSRLDLQLYYYRVCSFAVNTFLDSVNYFGKFGTLSQREAIAHYYRVLLLGTMMEWMSGGMKTDVKQEFAAMQQAATQMLE